ncbi:hypothetical protein CVIRNUC_001196 [Coccomyxa viridis]|uniref:Uncharacterized protein n=1 Tax=Coccomyxa viridis TaxID=1274662 RepID=A0AAV1HT06_9CHLO|nr:hypothetical protein CVIRNUC_001196 [Coccomyxa viridis]
MNFSRNGERGRGFSTAASRGGGRGQSPYGRGGRRDEFHHGGGFLQLPDRDTEQGTAARPGEATALPSMQESERRLVSIMSTVPDDLVAFHYDVVILPFRKQADEEGKPRPDLKAPHPARPEKPLGPEICRSAIRASLVSSSPWHTRSATSLVSTQASPASCFSSLPGMLS